MSDAHGRAVPDPVGRELDPSGYRTDKVARSGFWTRYRSALAPLRDRDVRILELGVRHGGSMLLWRDWFPRGVIAGLDVDAVDLDDETGRIRLYRGEQQDVALLDRIAAECAPDGFDVVIDDCAHVGEFARASFWHLFDRHLKPDGLYAIEDWGTGYWKDWRDGCAYRWDEGPGSGAFVRGTAGARLRSGGLRRWLGLRRYRRRIPSHDYGMVGFVKELVDEAAARDVTDAEHGVGSPRASRFASVEIGDGLVLVRKAPDPEA